MLAAFRMNFPSQCVVTFSTENNKKKPVPYQTQQAADLIDGSDAAEEAHGHGQGAHSDQNVGGHFYRVGGFLWWKKKRGEKNQFNKNLSVQLGEIKKRLFTAPHH